MVVKGGQRYSRELVVGYFERALAFCLLSSLCGGGREGHILLVRSLGGGETSLHFVFLSLSSFLKNRVVVDILM